MGGKAAGTPSLARAISLFKDCLTDGETLRSIDNLFNDLGIGFDAETEQREIERAVGERRARAAGYLATLDERDSEDRRRLVEVMSTKVAEWGDDPQWEHLRRLKRVMNTAGYEWSGVEFVARGTRGIRPHEASGAAATSEPRSLAPDPATTGPAVFVSYAHEDGEVAHALAAALRLRGCRVWIDTDGMRVGDKLVDRVATAIDEVDYLIALLSPASIDSAWCQRELSLAASGELTRRKVRVLPVRIGEVSLPATLRDTFSPLLDPHDIDGMADRLVADMASHRVDRGAFRSGRTVQSRPPIDVPAAPAEPPPAEPDEPMKILGIDVDNVGQPRNDGTRGSALYRVPLRLNRRPSPLWAEVFRQVWDHPPQFTTMHRPGIASVSGDRIFLDGTTVEEIERYHAQTLNHVIPEVNRQVEEVEVREREQREAEKEKHRRHDEDVRDRASRISFD